MFWKIYTFEMEYANEIKTFKVLADGDTKAWAYAGANTGSCSHTVHAIRMVDVRSLTAADNLETIVNSVSYRKTA